MNAPLEPTLAAIVSCPCGVITARTSDGEEAISRTSRHARAVHCMPEARAHELAVAAWAGACWPEVEPVKLPSDRDRPVDVTRESIVARTAAWHARAKELLDTTAWSDAAIATVVGVSHWTITQYRHRHGIPPHHQRRRQARA